MKQMKMKQMKMKQIKRKKAFHHTDFAFEWLYRVTMVILFCGIMRFTVTCLAQSWGTAISTTPVAQTWVKRVNETKLNL